MFLKLVVACVFSFLRVSEASDGSCGFHLHPSRLPCSPVADIRLLIDKSWPSKDFDQGRKVLSSRGCNNMKEALTRLRARSSPLSESLEACWDMFLDTFPKYYHSKYWESKGHQFVDELKKVVGKPGKHALQDPGMPEEKRPKVDDNKGGQEGL